MAGLGHAFSSTSPRARWLRPLLSRVLAWACSQARTRTLVQNPDDADTLLRLGIVAPGILHVVRSSGVDLARFAPKQTAPAACLVVAIMARLLRSKGIEEFVDAARHMRRAGRNMRFVVAGAIDEEHPDAVPAETVNHWHRQGLIHWVGHVDDAAAFLGDADVFALPSYYGEGVPRSLVEAAACGLPLVTTNFPGCREVVTTDGVDGLHVPPRDADALAQALMRLDDDRALMATLGQAARIRAAEFAEDNVLEQTLRLYEQLP
jgi:glycosyltransferase involved in cell wall biosynthesis